MGGAVSVVTHAVATTANAAVNAVKAPVVAATDIASGKNVGDSLGKMATVQASALSAPLSSVMVSTGLDRGVSRIPIVGGPVSTYASTSNEINTGSGNVSRGEGLNFWRSGGEIAAMAYGGAAVAGGSISAATALSGAGAAGSLARGNVAGAIGDLGGLSPDMSGLLDQLDTFKGIGNDFKPVGTNPSPANLGPYPNFEDPSSYGLAKTGSPASSLQNQLMVIAGLGAAIYFGRRFI